MINISLIAFFSRQYLLMINISLTAILSRQHLLMIDTRHTAIFSRQHLLMILQDLLLSSVDSIITGDKYKPYYYL